jgi:hypothetical protein
MPVQTAKLTPEQAREIVAGVLAAAKDKAADCERVVNALEVAIPVAFGVDYQSAVPALELTGKCASKVKRWRSVISAGSILLHATGDERAAPHIVRAVAELGEFEKAIELAGELAKQYPKAQAALSAALTFVYCRAEAWDMCEKTGDAALAILARTGAKPTDEPMIANRTLRALAWIVTGKPKDAIAEITAIHNLGKSTAVHAKLMAEAERARDRGFYFEAVPVPQLATGVYHLMGRKDTGALVTLKFREHAGTPRKFRIEAEVTGVTDRSSNTLELRGKEAAVRFVNPPIKMDFDMKQVRSARPSQLVLRVVELTKQGETTVVDETVPIEVLPRDYLPLRRKIGGDTMVPTFGFMGAWITSNDPNVEALLAKAKARVPGGGFVGEQDATLPQIKGLFEELKARGVSYVMDPDVTSEQSFVQRTRLPAEVIASTNAQCLEGTLLFATLMEAIGVKPIIVLVPGHAFVGWHTVPKDGTKGEPLFLETTMVGVSGFEDAVKVATQRVAQEMKAGTFKAGAATLIDVAAIRKAGFTAQPF